MSFQEQREYSGNLTLTATVKLSRQRRISSKIKLCETALTLNWEEKKKQPFINETV